MNLLNLLKSVVVPLKIKIRFRRPPVTSPVDLNQPVQYSILHPSVPELIVSVPIPSQPAVAIQVDKFVGGGRPLASNPGRAACVYVTITNALNAILGQCQQPPNHWPGTNPLWVFPQAGEGINAYYDRTTLSFLYAIGPHSIFTADSTNVVGHESGHAVLDLLRPDLWSSASLEIMAFHEAWADFIASMSLLRYDQGIDYLLSRTNGDLRRRNMVSDIAVQFCAQLHQINPRFNQSCLRSAINNYTYAPAAALPEKGNADTLIREPHSFSRVFFGAIYDVFVMMYEKAKQTLSLHDAVVKARDDVLALMVESVIKAPLTLKFYESVGKTMLWEASRQPNKTYYDDIRNILLQRKIISPEVRIQSTRTGKGIVTVAKPRHLKLSEISPTLSVQSTDGLRNVNIDLPRSEAYMYNDNGTLIDQLTLRDEEVVLAAEEAVRYLQISQQVGDCFRIENNMLQRTRIV